MDLRDYTDPTSPERRARLHSNQVCLGKGRALGAMSWPSSAVLHRRGGHVARSHQGHGKGLGKAFLNHLLQPLRPAPLPRPVFIRMHATRDRRGGPTARTLPGTHGGYWRRSCARARAWRSLRRRFCRHRRSRSRSTECPWPDCKGDMGSGLCLKQCCMWPCSHASAGSGCLRAIQTAMRPAFVRPG